jgi:hypothetical protein
LKISPTTVLNELKKKSHRCAVSICVCSPCCIRMR